MAKIETAYARLEEEIATGEAYAAKRLVAMYKLNWIGKIQLLATAPSFFAFINRKSSLERVLSQDETVLEKLRGDQAALDTLLAELNTKRSEKQALKIDLKRRITALNREQEKQAALLKRIQGKKELEQATLKSLWQAARSLDSTMATLEPATAYGRHEPPTGSPAEDKPFEAYKGLLSWPVKGKIISFFGPYKDENANLVNFQSGIDIRSERGEPIRAVQDGYAIYSSWFKGFGNMLIIDHGNHYYTVYAYLEEVFKVKGDRVEKGEVIATVGDSGSLVGPALHFEIRHHGKPVDPLEWINKG